MRGCITPCLTAAQLLPLPAVFECCSNLIRVKPFRMGYGCGRERSGQDGFYMRSHGSIHKRMSVIFKDTCFGVREGIKVSPDTSDYRLHKILWITARNTIAFWRTRDKGQLP